ncbi:hypothetical protein G7Y89_g13392 [Cudoniella acicularis]|uniref:Uncharacterized protein n=1 Tax=Cudoniella acicularis TaxID=354080 RepID=A0A8H4VWH4_9HELO|nr:hypothetical protein G7Y89_g13392 [Cudoniella acicularis]
MPCKNQTSDLRLVTSSHVSLYLTTYGPPIGTALGICAWLETTKGTYGTINIDTTFENWPMFTGCLVSLVIPLLMWGAMRPFMKEAYDWDLLFLMVARDPGPGDKSFTHEDDDSLGLGYDTKELPQASFMEKSVSAVLCLIFLIIIPFPMYGSGHAMSRKFFIVWTVLVFLWSWTAALMIWFMPVWPSRKALVKVAKGIFDREEG